MDDIFPESMMKLISSFSIDINRNIVIEESDLFAFKYTESELEEVLEDGVDANYEDFIGEDGYSSFDGRTVLIYIKHQSSMANKRKFHFTNCPIVSQNISKDVYDTKFVMTTRRDGLFKIFNPYGKEQEISLEPCGHCCNTAKLHSSLSVEEIYQKLENNLTRKKISKRPRNTHNAPLSREFIDGYVWNWKGISRIIRSRRGFRCEICNITLDKAKHLLHVHHKNRDKKDNTEENLHVLCVECHSNQDGHDHMRSRFSAEINIIRDLRKKLKQHRIYN